MMGSQASPNARDGVTRESLVAEILDNDRRIYQAILGAISDEWLRMELSNRQLKVLLVLCMSDGRGARMGQLAATLGVTLPTVTGIVDRLVEHELVRRDEDPADRRSVVARLAPGGAELMDRLRSRGRADFASTLERLGTDDLRLVARALDLLLSAALEAGGRAAILVD
jgi:DNA-binding MarR family transcriptional regulator